METADDSVQAVAAGELLHVAQRVDHAGVATAGDYDQALSVYVRYERLVVQDQLVRPPFSGPKGLMCGSKAVLEVGSSIHLAGYQQRAVEQERRLTLLHDLKSDALKRATTRRCDQNRITSRQREASPAPSIGMNHH